MTLLDAIKTSTSFRQVVIKLGKVPHGGTVSYYKKKIEKLGINTSHFLGQHQGLIKGGGIVGKKYSPEEVFKRTDILKGYLLKRVLLESGVVEKCSICGINEWNSKKLNLEVDHCDGNKNNNSKNNLRFVCPNCHSQTITYKFFGRKKGRLPELVMAHS